MYLWNNLMLILILLIIWVIFYFKFNLPGVQFLQGDHQTMKNNGLVFIKPENLSKAELVEKVKHLQADNKILEETQKLSINKPMEDSQKLSINKSIEQKESLFKKGYNALINYLTEFLNLFNLIKEVMFKLTFISFFIKLMLKYKILRQIISILRKILFLGVGSSFLNYFGFFDFFHEIWVQIQITFDYLIKYIKMYFEWLKNIFIDKKEEIETPEPNVDFLNNKIIIEKGKPISEEVDQYWTYSKIIMITSMVVISCFIYVYFEEIKDYFKPSNPGSAATDILNDDEKIELVNLVSDKIKSPEESFYNEPLKKFSEMTDNNPSSSKVKLEDLPTIEVRDSSGETIYHEVVKSDNLSSPTDSISSTETIKPLNWRSGLDKSTKETIEYVEKHFPDSELDNIDYIKSLIEEVKKSNMNFANQTKSVIDSLTAKELSDKFEIAKNTDQWVDNMFDKLKPFE
uniref:Uncharacterized protein n=1 Tax=Russula subnigricans TaxID=258989 RepID=A0A649WI16_9AGAM|nr:hypothetical protein [Russula subnigricans]QGK88096.1 hypothetical protein [Russula subnigricans]